MLPPQDLQQSLSQNEMQLTTGTVGDARVIFARAAPVSGVPSGANLTQSEQDHFRQVQRKVMYVASALGAMVIAQHIIGFAFNMAEMEAAINEIHEVAPKDLNLHWLPRAGSLIMGGVPNMMVGILGALIVPLCGYIGARQSNSKLMCCFSGCNFLGGCMGILSMLCLTGGLLVLSGAEPAVADFLAMCDPTRCTHAVPMLDRNQTIDCLAAPAPGYVTKYSGVPHLHARCPPIFLTCAIDPAWTRFCHSRYDAWSCKSSPGSKCIWLEESCIPNDQSAIAEKLLREHPYKHGRYLMAAPVLRSWQEAAYQQQAAAGPMMMPADGRQRFPSAALSVGHNPLELPEDPQASCNVDEKRLEGFAAIRKLAPRLLPMLTAVVLVKLLLAVPTVILGCIGFCWGKDLYNKLSSGYATINAPTYVGQPLFIQPAPQYGQPIVPGHSTPAPFAVMLQPMPVQGAPVQWASAPPAAQPTNVV
mmetsp:Transcript_10417/g.27790  ORF Transcript_10417/g.27790 Transcript_10417/m.27790 type:complete len:475 (-) Transcript_10417:237-1661(-)